MTICKNCGGEFKPLGIGSHRVTCYRKERKQQTVLHPSSMTKTSSVFESVFVCEGCKKKVPHTYVKVGSAKRICKDCFIKGKEATPLEGANENNRITYEDVIKALHIIHSKPLRHRTYDWGFIEYDIAGKPMKIGMNSEVKDSLRDFHPGKRVGDIVDFLGIKVVITDLEGKG